jgi:hypothetical protein
VWVKVVCLQVGSWRGGCTAHNGVLPLGRVRASFRMSHPGQDSWEELTSSCSRTGLPLLQKYFGWWAASYLLPCWGSTLTLLVVACAWETWTLSSRVTKPASSFERHQ